MRETLDLVGAVARYEAGKRARGTVVLLGLLVALAAMDIALFPSVAESGVDLDRYMESFPPAVREAFGGVSLNTIEGFLVAEFYQFAWVLLLGLYFAYRAGGMLAGDVERDRMDVLLSAPVSRAEVVLGKFLSLVPAMVLLNAVTPAAILAGAALIGESLPVRDVLAVHVLSMPYFLAAAALGILVSAATSRADVGQRLGLGAVFAMYLLDSVTARTDFEAIGALALPRYYDTAPILTEGEYDLAGAGILLVATAALLLVAAWWFGRRDIR